MNRPLETTFWMRFKHFMKGMFLYNTIYWRRASDDLEIQRMSREERAALRPKRNLDFIRPRENPRPPSLAQPLSLPAFVADPAAAREPQPPAPLVEPSAEGDAATAGEILEYRRRKKRRLSRRSQLIPKRYRGPSSSSGGMIGWLLRKLEGK